MNMSNRRNRKSPRLSSFDYGADGAYFITINAYKRRQIFGKIIDGRQYLSEIGVIAEREWIRTAEIRAEIKLDVYCIMPDHFHAIVWINNSEVLSFARNQQYYNTEPHKTKFGAQIRKLSNAIGQFKAAVTREVRLLAYHEPIWHKRYHDRIIRDHDEYERIKHYINCNPANWNQE